MSANKESWGTRVGLILAMAGNAVGLGNFLRFPVQAVQNGGGTFIIPYLICFLIMGIPLLWIEWSMGRFGGRDGNHSTPFILDSMAKNKMWKYFGAFGIFTNIGVASYYCYIESWTLTYVYHSVIQTFSGMTSTEVEQLFSDYTDIFGVSTTGIYMEAVVFYLICLLLNTYILSRGLSGGVERVAKFGMPLLLIFGSFLAFKGITLGNSGSPADCLDCDSHLALNFLWEPQSSGSLFNPKIWLAAAGQIFFTISVGMGTIHCYAAYVRSKDDIALNAMSAGWMNGFVEVVLGASVVIPIAAGYLGLDWIKENAGFSMAFKTMPYLFTQWGDFIGTFSGIAWFGLLFFAGITSSLAMGTPWMGFMRDEFGWGRNKGAWSFGGLVLLMGLPTVFFFSKGVFDEYDYWAGTVALVVFALTESILFAWIFGIDRGWEEITAGADIKVPSIYKPIIKYVTPALLLVVFLASLITPKDGNWAGLFNGTFELDGSSIIGKLIHKDVTVNKSYFADHFESEVSGTVIKVNKTDPNNQLIEIGESKKFVLKNGLPVEAKASDTNTIDSLVVTKTYTFASDKKITVKEKDVVKAGDKIVDGNFTNNVLYIDFGRFLLVALFGFITFLVFLASKNRQRKGKV